MGDERKVPARIDELLEAAVRAFAVGGYAGTSTAEVARQAGVSQPYIVRVFGTKERLFIQTHRFAGAKIIAAFRGAAETADEFDPLALGRAYRHLVLEQQDALMIYTHGFSATRHPAIAEEARRQFAEVYRLLRDLGATHEQMREFMGRGMLINNMLSMQLPRHAADLGMSEYLETVFGA